MGPVENWRTTEWRLRMGRDWSNVPDWNKPFNLRENEEITPGESEPDLGFQETLAVGMLAYAQQR